MSNILNNQSFTNLPTCSAVPSSGSQLINKTYGDATYATIAGEVTLSGANVFTGTNTFNTNLPTSTLTPTTSTQLITKAYGDGAYGILTAANTWSGSSSTFNTNPLFPTGATVGYIATVTNAGTGAWTWQASPVGPSTATVATADATPTTLVTISVASNSVVTFEGTVSAANSSYSDATGGTFSATVVNASGVLTLVNTPFVVVNPTSTATFNVIVSGTNVILQVTGIAATAYNWKAVYGTVVN